MLLPHLMATAFNTDRYSISKTTDLGIIFCGTVSWMNAYKESRDVCVCVYTWCGTINKRRGANLSRVYLRSPPCPFSRASYGEPGLRSTGHWCLLPTRLLPVSHGGCARNPGPLTTLYSHNSFTPATHGEKLCSSGEAKTTRTDSLSIMMKTPQ